MSERSVFQTGSFETEQGIMPWRIACDQLKLDDWECLALMLTEMIGPFGSVEGVAPCGIVFADSLRKHISKGPLLLVGDVMFTGKTMETARKGRRSVGAVLFSTGPMVPGWITPVFRMWQ